MKAKRVLEIGTLAGYSTMCFAQGLRKNGVIITIENDPKAIEVAEKAFKHQESWVNIQFLRGDAKEKLKDLVDFGCAPFDIIFIDADKPSNPAYLAAALKLSKAGTVIIGDNVIRDGFVADEHSTDPKVQGVRTFLDAQGKNRKLIATALQTVGSKGYDGFSMALVV